MPFNLSSTEVLNARQFGEVHLADHTLKFTAFAPQSCAFTQPVEKGSCMAKMSRSLATLADMNHVPHASHYIVCHAVFVSSAPPDQHGDGRSVPELECVGTSSWWWE